MRRAVTVLLVALRLADARSRRMVPVLHEAMRAHAGFLVGIIDAHGIAGDDCGRNLNATTSPCFQQHESSGHPLAGHPIIR
jgi:hypothetical protein